MAFDASTVATALPANVQGILNARVDRLAPTERALLQAASVIGRQFDSQLLAAAVGETDVGDRLAAMQAFDLIRLQDKSGNYAFKHALVRDALYQSLLRDARTVLHAKIAEEIERRSGNRLTEVAEVLAHHYSQTDSINKAFAYLVMAGSKSLGVYSLDDASTHLSGALALIDKDPSCASDDQVADFLVSYTQLLNENDHTNVCIDILKRYLDRIDHLDPDPRIVVIRHQYVRALFFNTRFRDAAALQETTKRLAERCGDSKSIAYSLTGEIFVSTVIAPKSPYEFETIKRDAVRVASDIEDAYIQNWIRYVIAWEEFHRGHMTDSRAMARELMEVGRQRNDPRSIGMGLALLTWITLVSDSNAEALEYSEQSLALAVTPTDRHSALVGKGCALAVLRQTEASLKLLGQVRSRSVLDGDLYRFVGTDAAIGISRVVDGNIKDGIDFLEAAILRREKEGYRAAADWYRLFLSEVYLQIISGSERLPFLTLLKNLPILLKVMATASSRIRILVGRALANPHFDPSGHHVGHAHMIFGLLYKAKKKRALSVRHLSEAKRILSAFGQTPILTRVETALAELGQQP